MKFLEELKRRNVIRVGIAYAVGAWLLLQLTDVLVDLLGLPDTAGRYVILLLVIGFPVALFFAWAFEMTPEGVKRESEVKRDESVTQTTGRKLDFIIIGVMAVALLFFVYDKFSAPEPVPVEQVSASPEPAEDLVVPIEPSIAVLPFVNMSNDAEQEYFSDGISEELLNLLVRVDGLKVASRTSSFTYKGENLNIPAIAAELKVNHILEGSVRKAGNRVRITAQLIDTSSDRHLWSDTFDRELVDIFAIQDEIANAIVDALKSELGIGLQSVSVATATENLNAYDLFLKGRGMFIARQNLDIAAQLFERATQLDPEFVQAWEMLAATHAVSDGWLAGDGIDYLTLAKAAAEKALQLDPNLSLAYAVLSQTLGPEAALLGSVELLDTAVKNDPKNATALLWRGIIHMDTGHFERAIADFEKCLVIDPAYLNCKQHMAATYLFWGKPDQATPLFEETIESNFHAVDEYFVSHYLNSGQRMTAFLLASNTGLGGYVPVSDWIDAIENPQQSQAARIAVWQSYADDQNISICYMNGLFISLKLDHCFADVDDGGRRMVWHPDAAYFKNTPAFKDVINKYMMSYWRKHGFPPQCRPLDDDDFECD